MTAADKVSTLRTAFLLAIIWLGVWMIVFFILTWVLDMKTPVLAFSITLWLSVLADVVYKFFERRAEFPKASKTNLVIAAGISVLGVFLLIAINKAHPPFLTQYSNLSFQGQRQFIICDFPTGKRTPEIIYLSGTTVDSEGYNELLIKEEQCESRIGKLKRDQFNRVVVTRDASTFFGMIKYWIKLLILPLPLFVLFLCLIMRLLFHKEALKILDKSVKTN